MEPVDKINARTDALADLGLAANASPDDIRNAWRQIAFHAHPDHTGGDCADFSRAKVAYDSKVPRIQQRDGPDAHV